MLDLKYVTEHLDEVEKRLATRGGAIDLTELKTLAEERKELIHQSESMKARKNEVSALIAQYKRNKQNADELIAEMKKDGERIKELDEKRTAVEEKLQEIMLSIPNLPDPSLPIGRDSDDNVEVRRFSAPRVFDFEPKAHWDIGAEHDLFSAELGARIAGTRFTVYRGWGAKLERAVINFMLDTHTKSGYTEVFPPFMINRDCMYGTGQLPKFAEDMYKVENTDFYLAPTAEVPVTNLHRGEILPAEALTIKYCAYTACFRGEAGSAGRDTRGLIRQHQFNKVELVKFAHPDRSFEELEGLTADAERILQLLELPYRVVCLCTGDIGFGSTKTYDLEVWLPSYGRYVEISSCSNYLDFQARRASIRFRDTDGKVKLVHTLNGSGLAVGRTVAAILENYQNADGSVTVPKALVPYLGTDVIR